VNSQYDHDSSTARGRRSRVPLSFSRRRRVRRRRRVCVSIALVLVAASPALEEATDSPASARVAAGSSASARTFVAVHRVARSPLAGVVTGPAIRPGFVGLSFEFPAVRAYTGSDPAAVNPVLVRLIRNLAPGASPVLRIGGDSTDWTWLPVPGVATPADVSYSLTQGWMRTTRALAGAVGGQLILGVNLAMKRPALAATEAQGMIAGLGRRRVLALEIGNEADVYRSFPRYRNALGVAVHVRNRSYSFGAFTQEFTRVRRTLPDVPVAGPAFGNSTWMAHLPAFLAAEPGLGLVTFHRYPLSCFAQAGSPKYPTIADLLASYASHGLAHSVARYVALAHAQGLQFRVDELNSVACGGLRGVSDTFAAALWSLNSMFELAKVGVDGVNVHTLPGAAYEPFSFSQSGGRWSAFVHPLYYGLLMFAQAAPPRARLLPTAAPAPRGVKLWATLAPDQAIRYVLINESAAARIVRLRTPLMRSTATLEQLRAPSLDATTGVTIGGQSFGASTRTGRLSGQPVTTVLRAALGRYAIRLAPASASLLTVCGAGCTARLR
jgi:hypothetical protein